MNLLDEAFLIFGNLVFHFFLDVIAALVEVIAANAWLRILQPFVDRIMGFTH